MIPLRSVQIGFKTVFARALMISMALLAGSCPMNWAANWIWDVGHAQSRAGTARNGNQNIAVTNWYDGISADVAWGQTSTTVSTNGAIFAGGTSAADGTCIIDLAMKITAINIGYAAVVARP
jgi:hypothetical protein